MKPTADREKELAKYFAPPRWIWRLIVSVIVVLFVSEGILIAVVLNPEWVLRLQTFNGTLMMTGGLFAVSVTTLLVMFPLKALNIYLAALYENFISDMEAERQQAAVDREELKANMKKISEYIDRNTKPIPKKVRGENGNAGEGAGLDQKDPRAA